MVLNDCVRFSAARQGVTAPPVDQATYAAMLNAIVDPTTGELLEYRHLIADPKTRTTWMTAAANEFGRLMVGLPRGIAGINTMSFIRKDEAPSGCMVTYARFCCDFRPQKSEPGGDRTDYVGEVSKKTADLTTIKCLLNSVVSKQKGRFMTADVKNVYLNTSMDRPEYMRISIKNIPQEIIDEYQVQNLVHEGHVYCKIVKGGALGQQTPRTND
jgi:hypothetical protein